VTFDTVFERTIGHEGQYSNDPRDPGGETNWGISKRSHPNLIIKSLTREQAKDIYLYEFWNIIEADTLPDSVAYQVFDFAVNSGIETAIRYFQRTLNVADDGNFGPESKVAMQKMTEPDMIMNLNAERLEFMTKLKNWPNASKGWARRIAQNLRYGSLDS
jgi:lysozyme family protein